MCKPLYLLAAAFTLLNASLCADDSLSAAMPFPPLPEAISSFGATVEGDYVYVFGGRMGRVAGSSVEVLSPHFCRVSISNPGTEWEELPAEQTSQSPGLVAWNGKIYRVGGLSYKNTSAEETHFNSLDVFAEFDPEAKTWKALPSLPIPRSSLDAAVVDGKLYVVGGWNLQEEGAQAAVWHDETLVFDLSNPEGEWKSVAKPPFQKRALAVAVHDHKLYVLGGMSSDNRTTLGVHVYDPASDSWTDGPELKTAGNFGGFAISAFATGGRLYYCGGDGTVYRLSESGTEWEPYERLFFSRMFHRLVPLSKDKLAVIAGIAGRGGYLKSSEVVNVDNDDPERTKALRWTIEFEGQAKGGQALYLDGATLYAFGGTSSRRAHDFAKETFLTEAYQFNLADRTVEKLDPLPHPVQSASAFLAGPRIDQSIYVAGGISHPGEKFSSVDYVQQYRLRSKAWSEEVKHLPSSRSMFQVTTHDRKAWFFGGSQNNDGGSGLVEDTWSWNVEDEEPITVVPEAKLETPRRSFGAVQLNNKYYVVGGLAGRMGIVDQAVVYDFETNEWSDIASPEHARVFPNLAVAGGKLYLSGGFSRVDGHFAGTTTIEVYDPEANTWSTAFEELAPTLSEMTMLSYQDRLLFYSIDKDQDGLAHFIILDPKPQSVGFGAIETGAEPRSEASEMVRRLMRLDRDRDGQLTREEVGARFQPIIDRIDADKDGIATKEEIETYLKQEQEKEAAERRATSTARSSEASPHGGSGRGPIADPVEAAKRFLEDNDANKDGVVDQEELEAMYRRRAERRSRMGGRGTGANPHGASQSAPASPH